MAHAVGTERGTTRGWHGAAAVLCAGVCFGCLIGPDLVWDSCSLVPTPGHPIIYVPCVLLALVFGTMIRHASARGAVLLSLIVAAPGVLYFGVAL